MQESVLMYRKLYLRVQITVKNRTIIMKCSLYSRGRFQMGGLCMAIGSELGWTFKNFLI